MKTEFKNFGALVGWKITDYHANAKVGALPYEIRQSDGNYKPFLPLGEWQRSDNGDSMSCVTFAEINSVETQEGQQTGQQINYSDRWIAKMSGTTREGNYLSTVAETIRKVGLVLESDYPAPLKYTWEEYHATIPERLKSQLEAKGKEWLNKWSVSYESVATDRTSLMKHIKHAPLIVIIPGHAVMNFYTTQDIINYFDSYEPFLKQTTAIVSALKLVITPKEHAPDPDSLFTDINYGDWGSQIAKLKRTLARNGFTTENKGELYDDDCARLVLNFQKANFPDVWWKSLAAWTKPLFWEMIRNWPGKLVGVETRKIINNTLNKR